MPGAPWINEKYLEDGKDEAVLYIAQAHTVYSARPTQICSVLFSLCTVEWHAKLLRDHNVVRPVPPLSTSALIDHRRACRCRPVRRLE